MFAVIRTGGKQYRVQPGDRFTVERLAAEPGETVRFDEVLMIGGDTLSVGAPMLDGAAVEAEVVDQIRGPKVLSFKRRRRKASSKRLKGHRQYLTLLEITEILAEGGSSEARPALGARAARRQGQAVAAPSKAASADSSTGKRVRAEAPETDAAPAQKATGTRPGNLLGEAKGDPDDLTRLSGVGPKLAEKLNAVGVFHFWQIAEWTPEEVAHMDEQLSFKGRIAREDWIGQAKTLAAEKN